VAATVVTRRGIFRIQQFVTPQLRLTLPFTFDEQIQHASAQKQPRASRLDWIPGAGG
jgi:hypothetical protein